MLDWLAENKDWLAENKDWVFSGVGVALVVGILGLMRRRRSGGQSIRGGAGFQNLQAGRDINVGAAPDFGQESADALKGLSKRMPALIEEMKADLQQPEHEFIREFFVVPNRNVVLNSQQPRLVYFEDEHENLMGKIQVLEGQGLLIDVTPGNTPMYRMTEEFVRALLELP